MMTRTEMEDVLRSLDLRVGRIEQILPTLATKEDLKEVMSHSRMLFEQLRGDIQLLAGHVADISQRLPPPA